MFVFSLHSRGNVFKLTAVIYLRQMPPNVAPQLPLSCLLRHRHHRDALSFVKTWSKYPANNHQSFIFLFQVTWTFPFFPNMSRTWSTSTRRWRAGSRSVARLPLWPAAWPCCCWVYFCLSASEWLYIHWEAMINYNLLWDVVNCLAISPLSGVDYKTSGRQLRPPGSFRVQKAAFFFWVLFF